MKKILLIKCLIALAIVVNAQNDTITILRPDSVKIENTGDIVSVKVYGNQESRDYRYAVNFDVNPAMPVETEISSGRREIETLGLPLFTDRSNRRASLEVVFGPGLFLGGNYLIDAPDNINLSGCGSYEIWMPGLLQFNVVTARKKIVFGLAYGLGWNNYRMKDNKRFLMNADNMTEVTDYPDGATPDFSRLKVFSQTLALTLRYNFIRKAYLRVGPVLSLNDGTSILTKYRDESGRKIKEKQNDPKVNRVTLGWLADVQFHHFGFYAKYMPGNIFRNGYGPEFSKITLGVSVGW